MQGIEITLYRNKQNEVENSEEFEVISGENNATTILVHFPDEYKDFSKRVDFKNIRNERWTIGLYTPEDETKQYASDFDQLNFAFTLPSAVTLFGELEMQFIAYKTDDASTFVPFRIVKLYVEDSVFYAKKDGSQTPDLIIEAYKYANMSLEISRDSFAKIENAERAALSAEASAKAAQESATSAQTSATNAKNSATSANTRAINAEASAKAAQESAEYAEQVSDNANTKSDNAVATSNTANTKSDNAVSTANTALSNSKTAINTSNTALTNSQNAVTTSNSANTKSDNAVEIATEAKEIAEESNEIASTANTKSDNAVSTANSANTKSTNAVNTANSANTKSNSAVTTANEAKTSATSAVSTANSANTKSDNAVSVANSANTKSDNAVNTANEAMETAEQALNQVVEKMGTKVYLGSSTTPESSVNFDSDPQTQITANKTLANSNKTLATSNKTRLDSHDTEISNIKNNTTIVANSNGGFSCGSGATNGTGMQFKGYTICDSSGKIPVARLVDAIYPIGSIYMSVNATDPKLLFGGTWVQLQDRFLLGAGTTYSNGAMGGSKDAVAVSHNHTITQNVGGTIGYGGWGTIYGSGYTSAPGEVSGNISMEENYNNGIGNWAGGGDKQRGRNVYARFRIPDVAIASAGESGADKNMPPYLVVYMWKRTA